MNLKSLLPVGRERSVAAASPFVSLQREIDRLFDDFTRGFPTLPGNGATALMPSMDVSETDKEIEITAELPGLEEKDVQINLSDNLLTIRGEKKGRKGAERQELSACRAQLRFVRTYAGAAGGRQS